MGIDTGGLDKPAEGRLFPREAWGADEDRVLAVYLGVASALAKGGVDPSSMMIAKASPDKVVLEISLDWARAQRILSTFPESLAEARMARAWHGKGTLSRDGR